MAAELSLVLTKEQKEKLPEKFIMFLFDSGTYTGRYYQVINTDKKSKLILLTEEFDEEVKNLFVEDGRIKVYELQEVDYKKVLREINFIDSATVDINHEKREEFIQRYKSLLSPIALEIFSELKGSPVFFIRNHKSLFLALERYSEEFLKENKQNIINYFTKFKSKIPKRDPSSFGRLLGYDFRMVDYRPYFSKKTMKSFMKYTDEEIKQAKEFIGFLNNNYFFDASGNGDAIKMMIDNAFQSLEYKKAEKHILDRIRNFYFYKNPTDKINKTFSLRSEDREVFISTKKYKPFDYREQNKNYLENKIEEKQYRKFNKKLKKSPLNALKLLKEIE